MSFLGVGPRLYGATMVYLLALAFMERADWIDSRIPPEACPWLIGLGWALVGAGVVVLIAGAVPLRRAYRAGRLRTTGLHGLCRHPLYGAWTFLIAPGGALLSGYASALTVPLMMYAALRVILPLEERWLRARFGAAYAAYAARVPRLCPFGRRGP